MQTNRRIESHRGKYVDQPCSTAHIVCYWWEKENVLCLTCVPLTRPFLLSYQWKRIILCILILSMHLHVHHNAAVHSDHNTLCRQHTSGNSDSISQGWMRFDGELQLCFWERATASEGAHQNQKSNWSSLSAASFRPNFAHVPPTSDGDFPVGPTSKPATGLVRLSIERQRALFRSQL